LFYNPIFSNEEDLIFCFMKRGMYEEDPENILNLLKHDPNLGIMSRGICPAVLLTLGDSNGYQS
jgi:hypothetical protein